MRILRWFTILKQVFYLHGDGDVAKYLGSQEPVKKTLTIPRWADTLGRELGLNFSQTLTDAIADKKIHA